MANKAKSTDIQPLNIPLTGYSRASQLLPFLPFGKSTLFKWSGDGRFPSPVKLSSTITCWKNEDVHAWLQRQAISQQAANDAQAV